VLSLTVISHEIGHASLIFYCCFPMNNLLHTLYLTSMTAVLFIELPSYGNSAPNVMSPEIYMLISPAILFVYSHVCSLIFGADFVVPTCPNHL
jgi:hypothetical protein